MHSNVEFLHTPSKQLTCAELHRGAISSELQSARLSRHDPSGQRIGEDVGQESVTAHAELFAAQDRSGQMYGVSAEHVKTGGH
mmetsp:Transcript_23668/g.33067  ORF Transcript_23668/g.33067 Transcript_23668/m.33067 type:complete len:83 (-) Transcript_23668:1110-1358(-)